MGQTLLKWWLSLLLLKSTPGSLQKVSLHSPAAY